MREADAVGERHASYFTDENLAKERLWEAMNGMLWRFLRAVQKLEESDLASFIEPTIKRMHHAIREVGDSLRKQDAYEAYERWKAFEFETQQLFVPPLIQSTGTVFLEIR